MQNKKTITASELNQRISEVTNKVAYGRETFVITKHGKPVAEIGPARNERIEMRSAAESDRKAR